MPAETADLHKLALALSRELPRKVEGDARARLEKIVRAKHYSVEASEAGRQGPAVNWRLSMNRSFTVPAVELAEGTPKSSVIVLADAGRTSMAADAARLLREGKRVIAVDPFYFGESRMATKDWLFAILMAALGERPLGIQASQVAATARWLEGRACRTVDILADGPRTGLAALVAAALEPKAIAGVTIRNGMRSLKEIIEKDLSADKTPELFCFGLLETFDIEQLSALAGRGKVKLENSR